MTKKLGICGVGMVGGALRRYFEEKDGIKLFLYDKGRNLGSYQEINQADIIFVCVPTPYDCPPPRGTDKGFDLSCVKEVFRNIQGKKTIVIKSTVVPGTTEKLQKQYPQHKVLFNPEFLTESTADQDMKYPDRQIIGYTEKSYNIAGDIMQLLPLAPFERIIPATEAEAVKYFGNTWFSTKVIFANQFYELCKALGIDYNRVMEAAAADKRIGRSHLSVLHKGYRGFGGKCLDGEEVIYEITDDGLKVVPIKDFQGKKILSMKDGKLIIDEVLAKSQREVKQTIKFHFSKGRTLETSSDHLIEVFDKKRGFIQKEATDIKLSDRIPLILGAVPLDSQAIAIDFFEFFSDKQDIFAEQVDQKHLEVLRPYLTFHQYSGLRRTRNLSTPAQAILGTGIGLGDLRIKTSKTGTWVPNSIKLDKDFARLIGYYLSGGCCSDRRVFFSFGYHEKELIEDTASVLKKLNIKFSTRVGYWKGHKSNFVFKVSSRILSEYFKSFGKDCYSKAIPSYMFSASQELKDELISGLFRGDGSIVKSNMGNYYTIGYATVSKNLIEGVDLLLREKEILASRKKMRAKKSTVPCYLLHISENKSVRKILPLLTFDKQQNVRISQRAIKSPAYERVNENIALLNVTKIERVNEPKLVYALETKSNHYLTSGGILTHNCLPKDIKALIQLAEQKGVNLKLHKLVDAINEELMAQQGIEDPEKFSKRD